MSERTLYADLRSVNPAATAWRRAPRRLLIAALFAWVCGAYGGTGREPLYKLLYSPASLPSPGGYPARLLEVEPGVFYGLSSRGTDKFGASIFTMTRAGNFKVIYSFPPLVQSYTLVQGPNGSLYGAGFISQESRNFYFSFDPASRNVQQYPVPGQWGSGWQLIAAPPGELYDIVAANPPEGSRAFALARIGENGGFSILHEFSGSDGAPTGANIVRASGGDIYGIGNRQSGGVSPGFIFRVTPAGAYQRLLTFPAFPYGGKVPLMADSQGSLYGVFGAGGANNTGEIYRASLSGRLETGASFPAGGMVQPQTLIEASDGNLYGTAGNTYIFRYSPSSRELAVVYQLDSRGSQGLCPCELIEGTDGKLYGVAPFGGNYPGVGTIFSLDIGLPKPAPVISEMYPASARAGQTVLLWGKYLLGAASVAFNGMPAASFKVTSGQSVRATVPRGAATGPVTIKTAGGSFTTRLALRVLPANTHNQAGRRK